MSTKFINNLALLGAITTTGLQGSENPGDFLNGKNQELGTTQAISHQTAPQSSGTQQTGTQQGKVSPVCMFIVSKYFENIDDFINLEKTCKKYAGNMKKFHYNPISFKNEQERALFPKIETFHAYGERNKIFNDGNITKQVYWNEISYSDFQKLKDENKELNKEFKSVALTQVDVRKLSLINEVGRCTVPVDVMALGKHCFYDCQNLTSISIPSSVSSIGDGCFFVCKNLKSITIPSSVSSIGKKCFHLCYSLKSITLPIRFKGQEQQIDLDLPIKITYTQDNQSAEKC